MEFHYPNGKKYNPSQQQIAKKGHSKLIRYGNRGMTLEEDLNLTNQYYLEIGHAVIHKKPTPIQIVQVDYPARSAAVIKEAYFKQPSTTDYNGVYKGRYIDFEAKETKNLHSFPLQNFHEHQIRHMMQVEQQKGISFVIIRFTTTDEVFLLPSQHLFRFWERMKNGGRKSIKKEEIENYGKTIPIKYQPRIDYLEVVDILYHSYF